MNKEHSSELPVWLPPAIEKAREDVEKMEDEIIMEWFLVACVLLS